MAPYKRRVSRHCRVCLAPRPNPDGPDPCLGMLPGVAFACCGHGFARAAYVLEEKDLDRRTDRTWDCPRGDEARERMRELGGNPPDADQPWISTPEVYWPRDAQG